MYESRTSRDIESAFQLGRKTAKVQVAGFFYVIDFGRPALTALTHPLQSM